MLRILVHIRELKVVLLSNFPLTGNRNKWECWLRNNLGFMSWPEKTWFYQSTVLLPQWQWVENRGDTCKKLVTASLPTKKTQFFLLQSGLGKEKKLHCLGPGLQQSTNQSVIDKKLWHRVTVDKWEDFLKLVIPFERQLKSLLVFLSHILQHTLEMIANNESPVLFQKLHKFSLPSISCYIMLQTEWPNKGLWWLR